MASPVVIEPPRKALRWTLLPTWLMGGCAVLTGLLSLLKMMGGGSGLPLPGVVFAVLVGGSMVGLGLWGLNEVCSL